MALGLAGMAQYEALGQVQQNGPEPLVEDFVRVAEVEVLERDVGNFGANVFAVEHYRVLLQLEGEDD